MRARGEILFLAVLLGASAYWAMPPSSYSAHGAPPKRTILVQKELEDIGASEATMYILEMTPGAVTGKLKQSTTEIAYVLEGTVFVVADGRAPVTLKGGDVTLNPGNLVYNLTNPSMTETAKMLVVSVGRKGQAVAVRVH
jgi:quercetin dioxygenase-like cupin family protein